MLINVLSFIFVLGVLIFVHELGHFLVAKRVGIKVERFSLGFPPYVFSRTRGETTYSIGLIPLGGFVKMAGENPDETATGDPREFMSKKPGQRAAVIFAGPFMNYILAILLLAGVYYFAGEPVYDETRVTIGELDEGGPAAKAGLKIDDEILTVAGAPVVGIAEATQSIRSVIGGPVDITWRRGGDTLTATMITAVHEVEDETGGVDSIGRIGVAFYPTLSETKAFSVWEATSHGFVMTHVIVYRTVEFLKQYITGEIPTHMIGGPLFIAQQSGKEARRGGEALFRFMALLSINLAVLNILPIPVLDGGHLLFLAIEKVKGSPMTLKARLVAQQVGVVALLAFIVFVTYNDILRAIGKL